MHLSDYMKQKNLKDEDVAEAIQRSRATVSRIRRGKVRLPSEQTLAKLKDFSDGQVTADAFVHERESA